MWHRLINGMNKITLNVTMGLVCVMVLVVSLQMLTRIFFSFSFSWTDELSRYCMIWIIFLGGGLCFRYGAHISIELVFDKLPNSIQKYAQLLSTFFSSVFVLVLFIYGIDISSKTMVQSSVALSIPMGYVYMIIPISCILMFLNMIELTLVYFRKEAVGEEDR